MTEEIFKIQGMYCENCARRIERKMKSLEGVASCHADFRKEQAAVVYYPEIVDRESLCACIRELGYDISDDLLSRRIQIISVLVILMALYLIADHLGFLALFNIFPVIETGMSYGTVFFIGLLTGVHCIAMCGGINLTQSVLSAEKKEDLLRSNLLYNLGRVLSYTLIGGIAGTLGGVIGIDGKFRGLIMIAVGLAIWMMSFRMLGVFRQLRSFRLEAGIPAKLYRAAGRLLKNRSGFAIGLVNGLMPCGPLQSMQIYALSTGSFAGGALSMLLFSLGTVPIMFGFGTIAGKLNRKYARYMLTVSAMLVFIMGLGMMRNGLSLSGVSISMPSRGGTENMAVVNGEWQYVRSEIDYGRYESISVRNGIPVEWTIHVPEGRLNGCNREILVPEYGLDIKLHEGDNLVIFTPDRAGILSYTCWMGMIQGNINVR